MGPEELLLSASQLLRVSPETVLFLLCLFGSIPLASSTRLFPTPAARAAYSIAAGAAICYVAYGGIWASVRLWAPTLLSYAVIRAWPRDSGYIVFASAFAYLVVCHVVSMSGDIWRKGGIDFTGTLMVFTLKLVGCAMDVQDGQRVKGEEGLRRMYANRLEQVPSLLEFLGFVFFPGGVLVGPVFDFKAFRQYIRQEGVWVRTPDGKGPPSPLSQALISTTKIVVMLLAYLFLTSTFPGSFMTEEGFFRMTFPKRWLYAIASGIAFRSMYYFIWSVSEVAMVLSEFGYSGPSETDPLWSRAINGNFVKVEITSSTSQMPAYWNIWVGRWLRTYVYDRLTPSTGKPSVWELIATQIVSALWHGLYPGYYLFFVNAAIAQNTSKAFFRAQQVLAPQPSPGVRLASTFGHSAFKQLMINYAITGFVLLRFDQTIAVWRSMYFLGTIIPLGLGFLVPALTPKPRRKKD